VAIEPTYAVEQVPSLPALVDAGLGITVLPALTLAMLKGTDLVARPLSKPTMRRHIGIVTLVDRSRAEPFTALLGHLRRSLKLLDEGLKGTFPASDAVSVGHFTGTEVQ